MSVLVSLDRPLGIGVGWFALQVEAMMGLDGATLFLPGEHVSVGSEVEECGGGGGGMASIPRPFCLDLSGGKDTCSSEGDGMCAM